MAAFRAPGESVGGYLTGPGSRSSPKRTTPDPQGPLGEVYTRRDGGGTSHAMPSTTKMSAPIQPAQ